jgi:hypothetical protein
MEALFNRGLSLFRGVRIRGPLFGSGATAEGCFLHFVIEALHWRPSSPIEYKDFQSATAMNSPRPIAEIPHILAEKS